MEGGKGWGEGGVGVGGEQGCAGARARPPLSRPHLHHVAVDDLQLRRERRALHAPLQLQHHARVQLNCHHSLGAL